MLATLVGYTAGLKGFAFERKGKDVDQLLFLFLCFCSKAV